MPTSVLILTPTQMPMTFRASSPLSRHTPSWRQDGHDSRIRLISCMNAWRSTGQAYVTCEPPMDMHGVLNARRPPLCLFRIRHWFQIQKVFPIGNVHIHLDPVSERPCTLLDRLDVSLERRDILPESLDRDTDPPLPDLNRFHHRHRRHSHHYHGHHDDGDNPPPATKDQVMDAITDTTTDQITNTADTTEPSSTTAISREKTFTWMSTSWISLARPFSGRRRLKGTVLSKASPAINVHHSNIHNFSFIIPIPMNPS